MDRSACLQADRNNIRETFGKYDCEICELIGYGKDELLRILGNDAELRKTLNIPEGIYTYLIAYDETSTYILGEIDFLMVFLLTHGNRGGVLTVIDERTSPDTKASKQRNMHPRDKLEMLNKKDIWDAIAQISFLQEAFKIYFMGVSIQPIFLYNLLKCRLFQPCRGDKYEENYVSVKEVELPKKVILEERCIELQPAKPNHVIVYSTVEGKFRTQRNELKSIDSSLFSDNLAATHAAEGTRLVKHICLELNSIKEDIKLEVLLTKYIHKIAEIPLKPQTPELVYFPSKQVVFR
jgi:hypothetical protein